MVNADRELATVRRLSAALKAAASKREHDELKVALGLANKALAKKRAQVINAQSSKEHSSEFKQWQNVPRSSLSAEQKKTIIAEYGMKNYLSMPQ